MSRYPLDPFPFGWFHVAFAADLAPGDVRPLPAFGRQFVLWRDEQGEPHVQETS